MAYPAKPIPAYPWSPSCDPYIHPHIQVLSYHAPPSYKMPPSAFEHIYPCDPSYAYFQGASSRLSEYYSVAFSNMKPSPTFEPAYIPLHHGDPRAFTSQAAEFALREAGIVSSSPSTPPFSTADLSFSCGSTDVSSVMSPFSSPSSTLSRSPSQYFTPLTSSFSKSEMSYPFEDAYPLAQGYNTTFESVPEYSYSFLPLKLERPSAAERIRIAEALNMKTIFSAQVDDHEDNAFERIELDYGSSSEEEEIVQGRDVGRENGCGKVDALDFRCRGE